MCELLTGGQPLITHSDSHAHTDCLTTCTNTGKDKPAENASTLLSNSFLTPLQYTYRESKRNKQGGENKHLPSVVSVFNTIGEKERAPQRPDILNIYSQNQTCAYGLISRRMSEKHTQCVYRGEWCRLIEHGVVGYLRCMSDLN